MQRLCSDGAQYVSHSFHLYCSLSEIYVWLSAQPGGSICLAAKGLLNCCFALNDEQVTQIAISMNQGDQI